MAFTIETAIELAAKKHAGQKRLNGEPYIYHLLRVMSKMETDDEKIVAVLHDILEDTTSTTSQLQSLGCFEYIIKSITFLTKDKHISYDKYIHNITYNSLAHKVKIADLEDNLNISDLGHELTRTDIKRISKYIRSINYLRASL